MPRGKRSVKRSETSLNEPDTQIIAKDVFKHKSKKWNVGYVPLIPEFCREPGCECRDEIDSSQKLNQGHLTPSTTTGGGSKSDHTYINTKICFYHFLINLTKFIKLQSFFQNWDTFLHIMISVFFSFLNFSRKVHNTDRCPWARRMCLFFTTRTDVGQI